MKILYSLLLFLISISSVIAQKVSVSFTCEDGVVITNLTAPGGAASSGVIWYIIHDSHDPSITEDNAYLMTGCYISPHYYEDGGGHEVECCDEDPYGEEKMAATSQELPMCIPTYSDQTVSYWNYSNPTTMVPDDGIYKIKCFINGNWYYSDYFGIPSYENPDMELCGSYSEKSDFITFDKITTCSTGVTLNSSGDPNDLNNGNLYLKAGNSILLSPGFFAPYASNLLGVIGDVCDGSSFKIGNFTNNKAISVKPSKFSIYPNPSNGKVSINISEKGEYKLYVDDMYGKTVYENKFNSNFVEADLQNLKPGIYNVRISGNDQKFNSEIIIY